MTAQSSQPIRPLTRSQWLTLGAAAAITAIVAVLVVEMLALAIWPDIATFKPLDSLVRAAVFTLIPALLATALFAWLSGRQARPDQAFLGTALIVLLISIIPDYLLPVPGKTFLASTVTAFLHVVAAAVIVSILVMGYRLYVR